MLFDDVSLKEVFSMLQNKSPIRVEKLAKMNWVDYFQKVKNVTVVCIPLNSSNLAYLNVD